MPIARRMLLKALAAAVASVEGFAAQPAVAAASNAPATPAEFAAVSAALTGYPAVDAALAKRMQTAFATPARRAALGQLARLAASTPAAELNAAIRDKGLDTIANELVAAWYSGVVSTPKGAKVVAYTDAMMWTAMSYTKPMGVCGGPFGYWAKPPQ